MAHKVENGADYSANLGYESRFWQMVVVLCEMYESTPAQRDNNRHSQQISMKARNGVSA